MKLIEEKSVTLYGEGSLDDRATLEVRYDNRGEPYRKGISLWLTGPGQHHVGVFLEIHEAQKLAFLIDQLYPRDSTVVTRPTRGAL